MEVEKNRYGVDPQKATVVTLKGGQQMLVPDDSFLGRLLNPKGGEENVERENDSRT